MKQSKIDCLEGQGLDLAWKGGQRHSLKGALCEQRCRSDPIQESIRDHRGGGRVQRAARRLEMAAFFSTPAR